MHFPIPKIPVSTQCSVIKIKLFAGKKLEEHLCHPHTKQENGCRPYDVKKDHLLHEYLNEKVDGKICFCNRNLCNGELTEYHLQLHFNITVIILQGGPKNRGVF